MRHILSVQVENEPGVLSRVVGLFSGRGFNIESLNVGPTLEEGVSPEAPSAQKPRLRQDLETPSAQNPRLR